jgi:hypothetical protein
VKEFGPCPVFASFTLAFALQLRKKNGKTSVRVRRTSVRLRETSVTVQYTYYQKHPHVTKPSQTHTLQNPLIHTHTHAYNTTKQYKTTTVQIKTKLMIIIKINICSYFDRAFKEAHLIDSAIPSSHSPCRTITGKLRKYTDMKVNLTTI